MILAFLQPSKQACLLKDKAEFSYTFEHTNCLQHLRMYLALAYYRAMFNLTGSLAFFVGTVIMKFCLKTFNQLFFCVF